MHGKQRLELAMQQAITPLHLNRSWVHLTSSCWTHGSAGDADCGTPPSSKGRCFVLSLWSPRQAVQCSNWRINAVICCYNQTVH